MATHCGILAWGIPGVEAPGELQSRHQGWRVRTVENGTSGRRSWCPERHLHAQAETLVVQHNCCFPSFLLNLFSHWLNTMKFHPWTTMGSRDLTLIFSRSLFQKTLFKIFTSTYLSMPCLSCSKQDLQCSLWHVGSSSLTRDGTQSPCTGRAVLATGPPEKSIFIFFPPLCPSLLPSLPLSFLTQMWGLF